MPSGSTAVETRSWALRLPRGRVLSLGGRPRVMGVLNITPDSFSDGGSWLERDRALERGLAMLEEGADLLDLGAESTRPGGGVYGGGAETVSDAEEIDRLLPVLEALRPLTDAPLSVDTRKGRVARAALEAGADLINDVSALGDPELGVVVADAGCPLILMHSRGELSRMQKGIAYTDAPAEVASELEAGMARAEDLGIARDHLILDPGIGFGKRVEHNVQLIGGLASIRALGRPVLLGASRKSFIGDLTGAAVGSRLPGSLAAVAWAAQQSVEMIRVHDVAETVQFVQVFEAVRAEAAATGGGA